MLARTLLIALSMTASALAQSAQNDDSALGGPRVVTEQKPVTIVEREMDGTLKKLETRPEQAALDQMTLTAEEKSAVEKVLSARAAAVGALLAENQALFLKIQQARQANAPREEMIPLMREFRPLAQPLVKPALLDQLSEVLPAEKAKQLRSLVAEYLDAQRAEAAKEGRTGPDSPTPARGGERRARGGQGDGAMKEDVAAAIPERVEINLLLREMGRSLKGLVDERRARGDALMKAVEATPEQEEQIQAIVRGAGDNAGLRPTREQRQEIRKKIMAVLTPEQQKKLIAFERQ